MSGLEQRFNLLRHGTADSFANPSRNLSHEHPLSLHRQLLALDSGRSHVQPPGSRRLDGDERGQPSKHPRSLALLEREGIPAVGLSSKSCDDLPETPDIVITVCSSAAGETCPAYLGPVLRAHWGVEDPAHAAADDEAINAAFTTTHRILRTRIEAFLSLPLPAADGVEKRSRMLEGASGSDWYAFFCDKNFNH
jgi:arsenate reductase